MSFKGVSSAWSERLSKILLETGSNPIEPQHFLQCLHPFCMASRGEFTCQSKRQREPSTPDPQLRSKRHYGSDSIEAGWDHHFVHSSMQGMTINLVIFAKRWRHVLRPGGLTYLKIKSQEDLLDLHFQDWSQNWGQSPTRNILPTNVTPITQCNVQ